ncbi:MAG: hypothetical protein EOO06_16800, partial [Chitinophagaceae bacterium]
VEPAAPTGGGTAGSPVKVYLHGFKTKASGTSTTYAVAPDVLSTYLDSSKWTLSTPGQAGIFSTYLSGAGMDSALGFAVTPTTGSAMTLTFKVKAGYRLNILSFSFYNRTTATNWGTGVTTGYKNWLMTINGLQVGADTMNREFTMVSTGTRIVENPANGLMGTVTVVLNFSNSFDKTGTLRIDSFTLNGYVEQIPDTGHDPVTTTDGKGYRYKFNGKEEDLETSTQDYGMRIYDPRLGKFLSEDPLFKEYPWFTPYQFGSNNPITCIDLDGLEGLVATGSSQPFSNNSRPIGMVLSPQDANRIAYVTAVAAFKLAFSEPLAKKLIDNYAYGNGKKYILNKNETVAAKVAPTGIGGITTNSKTNFNSLIANAKKGSTITLPDGYSIEGAATEAGTLGRFTIKLSGTITFDKEDASKWVFEGVMQFWDQYDFETQKEPEGGLKRSEWGDYQTDFARKHLPGKAFEVLSEEIQVKQTSEDTVIDWFKGKKADGKSNRVPNEVANNPGGG